MATCCSCKEEVTEIRVPVLELIHEGAEKKFLAKKFPVGGGGYCPSCYKRNFGTMIRFKVTIPEDKQ